MNRSNKLYEWEGAIYQVDLDAPAGSRVLVKEGDTFLSKSELGKLGVTILFEGMPISEEIV